MAVWAAFESFEEAKQRLSSTPVLAHYDSNLPLVLAGDASQYGIGAVISHTYPDGSERPIAYTSRTLSSSERNYAQLEKEALSLVYGVRKFHTYLYGRSFTILTDHKPLTKILGPKQGIPALAAARLQRWALILAAYRYDIKFKSTEDHANADGLSRLPLPRQTIGSEEASIFNIKQMEALPVTAMKLRRCTRYDPVLSRVLKFTKRGWPNATPSEDLKPYFDRREEISIESECLLWGVRVIVPQKLPKLVLDELHSSHPGVVRMKTIARSYFWWPKIDQAIEVKAKSCNSCKSVQAAPHVAPLHPWVWPAEPWERIHVDFAGPFLDRSFLVVVDANSKWPEVIIMSSTTSLKTIEELRKLFARYGLPKQLVTDNGPQFISSEFQEFMKCNGIKHIRSAPYHPSSNGQAERFIQTFKRAMEADRHLKVPLQQRLSQFLITYQSTPHSTTNSTPCELFLKRSIRTRFDLLRPEVQEQVLNKQARQKQDHDGKSKLRELAVGNKVMVRNFREGRRWIPGEVVARKGPLSYDVSVGNRIWKRHVDHLKSFLGEIENEPERVEETMVSTTQDNTSVERTQERVICSSGHRYPRRNRRPPDRYS